MGRGHERPPSLPCPAHGSVLPAAFERLGTPAYLLPALAAVAGGATWASHGDADLAAGRTLRAGAGVLLLVLLALPTGPLGARVLDGWPCAAAPLADALGGTFDPATRDACIDGDASLHARTVILVTGSTWRDLEVGGREPGSLSPCCPNVSRSPRS